MIADTKVELDADQLAMTGGSFTRMGVPQAGSTAMYDAANQQLTLRTKTLNTSSLSRALGGTLFMA